MKKLLKSDVSGYKLFEYSPDGTQLVFVVEGPFPMQPEVCPDQVEAESKYQKYVNSAEDPREA